MPNDNITAEQLTFDLPSSQPIKGYPELRWAGKRPFTSTQYFPAQLKESYGDSVDGWKNRIYWGDNLQVMSHLLKEFRGKVDLIYIDPPFDSKADYKKRISLRGKNAENDRSSFEEKQYGDIWTNDEYLQFIYERIVLLRELLSETGSIYVHCDWRANSYIRLILDEVFGKNNFRNELIWHYANTGLKARSKKFHQVADTLFVFAKTNNFIYNHLFKERKDGQAKQAKRKFNPITKKADMVRDEFGKIVYEIRENVLENSLWETGSMSNSPERLDYPTQKPEALLERVIKASSNPNSIVFDCFMGSGTTQAVAMKLGRRFIGADINLGAIQTTTKRLNSIIQEKKAERATLIPENPLYLNFDVYNVNNYDVFRNPVQAKELLIQALEIEPLNNSDLFDGMKDGYKVKIMPVNRIATRADLNPLITGINYRELDKRMEQYPSQPVEHIMLICMGHEPDLAANLELEIGAQYKLEIKVVDILREKERGLTFKYDSEAEIIVEDNELVISQFFPRNLLQKLSILDENIEDWRELVETVAIDWNYNGEVLQPAIYDIPEKKELVQGRYTLPEDFGTIRVKITDLLSESLEMTVEVE